MRWRACWPVAAVAAQAAKAPIAKLVRTGAEVTFDAWDKDHNGQLSREEFRAGWERAQQALQAGAPAPAFLHGGRQQERALEPAEYATSSSMKKEADAPMSRFDSNKDGKLQFGEYLGWCRRSRSRTGVRRARRPPSRGGPAWRQAARGEINRWKQVTVLRDEPVAF